MSRRKIILNLTGFDEPSLPFLFPVMAVEIIKMLLPCVFPPSFLPLLDKEVAVSVSMDSEACASQDSPDPGLLRWWVVVESCGFGLRSAVGRRPGGDGEAGAVDPRVEKGEGEGRAFPGS